MGFGDDVIICCNKIRARKDDKEYVEKRKKKLAKSIVGYAIDFVLEDIGRYYNQKIDPTGFMDLLWKDLDLNNENWEAVENEVFDRASNMFDKVEEYVEKNIIYQTKTK